MISLFWIVVHVTVFSGADTALTKAWVPLELVFAKYILLPQKTSANFRAPFIGISVISFCLTVPIKAAALLFYSAEKYFQSVQALLFLFRRIAILSLPKEKASWQLKALFRFCWITIHPLLPRPSGRPTGLTVVLNIIAIGGLSISFIPVATIWEPLLFYIHPIAPSSVIRTRTNF